MRDVHLASVDLNLLPALEALLRRKNVSAAAADVGLSQPAMSRALARLRDALGDVLLIRAPGGGFALSPRAEALAGQLAGALDQVKAVFRPPVFDPALAERTVRMVGLDTHAILLAPPLMARLAKEAPAINIRIENYSADMIQRMEMGQLDLAFAISTTPLPPGAQSEPYGHDRLALVMRRDHPMAKKKWTIEDYGRWDQVGISILGDAGSDMDAQLARFGVQRRMALVTPTFIGAVAAVAQTDMVTTIGRVFSERFADQFGLVLKEPPLPEVKLETTIVWSRVRGADPVLAWLRGVIREVARTTMSLPENVKETRVSRRAEKL
ncbi:MAG: LysR family transcriptional regulator [Sphingomonadales bacterium]|jgi:DNA-binding transcriptional LysR family regulator|nr:MAG: LysR family transcriptional regulator [Sphingomonadales bacterium]